MVREGLEAAQQAVRDNKEQISKVESDLALVKVEVCTVKSIAENGVKLGEQAVEQNKQILARLDSIVGEVKEVTEETADGVKVVTKVKRWGQTASDLHLDKWGMRVAGLLGLGLLSRLLGFVAGPEIRDKLLHLLMLR